MLTFSVSRLDSKARLTDSSPPPPNVSRTKKFFASHRVTSQAGWSVLLQRNGLLEPA